MGRSKGTNLVHMRTWAESHGGWDRVLAAMSAEDREELRSLVAVGWYELALQHRVLRAVDRALGAGDGALVPTVARFEADEDLTRIHRLFLRMANPAYVLEKAGEYWRRFYDVGAWSVERVSSTAARGRLEAVEPFDVLFCAYLLAYVGRMFELVGAKSVAMTHESCRAQGANVCIFLGTWR